MTKVLFKIILLLCLMGYSQAIAQEAKPKVLAIGDSLLAWHKLSGRSISQIAAKELGYPIKDNSLSGARILYKLPISGSIGFSIPRQYRSNDWDWVILNGGGNDLWLGCGCTFCKRKLNRLISTNAKKGAIPKLVKKIRKSGSKVLYVGYLRSPGRGSPIDHCKDEGDILENRLTTLAGQDDGFHFLSLKQLVPDRDLSYHAADRIHPSVKGSKAIGKMVAEIIAE